MASGRRGSGERLLRLLQLLLGTLMNRHMSRQGASSLRALGAAAVDALGPAGGQPASLPEAEAQHATTAALTHPPFARCMQARARQVFGWRIQV